MVDFLPRIKIKGGGKININVNNPEPKTKINIVKTSSANININGANAEETRIVARKIKGDVNVNINTDLSDALAGNVNNINIEDSFEPLDKIKGGPK